MAIQVPPLWLTLGTAAAYTVFFAFYGADILGTEASASTPGSTGASALTDFFSTIWGFITSALDILTFGATSDVVSLHPFVSWILFLLFTLPWTFYIISAIIEGIKALGGLIPFTMVLLVLLAVPAASGDPGDDVRQYLAFVHTTTTETGEVPETVVAVDSPHHWNRSWGESVLEVRGTYIVQAGSVTNPTATFRVLWDGEPVPSCTWNLQGGTISGGRFNPAVSIYCQIPSFVEPGNHTIQVERTQVSGSPVNSATLSIVLHQRESVNMNMEMNITNLELWIPIFLALSLVVLGVLMGFDFVAVGGTVALVAMMFLDGAFMGIEAWKFAITLALFGLLGEYVAYRRQDQIEKRDRRHTA